MLVNINDNRWLYDGVSNIDVFTVDRTKQKYFIQYFKTKNLTNSLNSDWKIVKSKIDEVKNDIREINNSIDSDDYKSQTVNIIKALDSSVSALDSNLTKLFNSIVKRLEESAKSDEWFSEAAKMYAESIRASMAGDSFSKRPRNGTSPSSVQLLSLNNDSNENIDERIANAQVKWEEIDKLEKAGIISAEDAKIQKDYWHNIAENARAEAGYSGGDDGTKTIFNPENNAADGLIIASSSSIQSSAYDSISEPTNVSPTSSNIVGEGKEIDIPSSVKQTGLCPNYSPYDRLYGKWTKNTGQAALAEKWAQAGKTSSNGIATLNDRYLVAVSPKFGTVGDNIDIVLNDGQIIHATIADLKGNDATSEWGHVLTRSGAVDIIEWEATVGHDQSQIDLGSWKNVGVDKIVNITL